MGWFDGDPVNLQPQSFKELGADIIEIAGSADNILKQAEKTQKQGRHQATLELCEMILANNPENQIARKMKIISLIGKSRESINGSTVNYYKTFVDWEKRELK